MTTKKPASSASTSTGKTQSVSTRKIVKKPLPSKTGRGKTPSVRTRVIANIEKKQANEEKDKKSASGNSMRDKIRHASGWRWM